MPDAPMKALYVGQGRSLESKGMLPNAVTEAKSEVSSAAFSPAAASAIKWAIWVSLASAPVGPDTGVPLGGKSVRPLGPWLLTSSGSSELYRRLRLLARDARPLKLYKLVRKPLRHRLCSPKGRRHDEAGRGAGSAARADLRLRKGRALRRPPPRAAVDDLGTWVPLALPSAVPLLT